jgi:hypothetical protein
MEDDLNICLMEDNLQKMNATKNNIKKKKIIFFSKETTSIFSCDEQLKK